MQKLVQSAAIAALIVLSISMQVDVTIPSEYKSNGLFIGCQAWTWNHFTVFEAIEAGTPAWHALDVSVIPGISAMQAAAARLGAPLGHDFCALSLSDNLKPWELIERRLDAAASVGFVIALYNPISRARPWQLGVALERLRQILPASTPVVFGRAVGRVDEHVAVTTLAAADPAAADMATLVIVGSSQTRAIARPGRTALVYTPRAVQGASA